MRSHHLLFYLVVACLSCCFVVEGKTVFRRTDKISENFKRLDLPAAEIDPNVAPPQPQKIETIDPQSASTGSGSITAPADEVLDEAVEAAAAASVANEPIDESLNELEDAVTTAPAAEPTPASSSSSATPVENQDDPSAISKYCKCTDSHCDCCRQFNLPLIPVRGPGCAKITYLGNEKMSVSIKYGDITLATRTISGKRAKPICVGLPGGYSKFCGRVYGLSKGKEDFKACLGFELRAEDEVEAALRVSCFKFGPDGLRVAEAEPLPTEVHKDEDEDDDIFGFGAGGDDDDDDYDDEDDEAEEEEVDEADEEDETEDNDDDEADVPEDADYGGFSLGGLLEELADEDDDATSIKPAGTPAAPATRTAERKESAQGKDDKGAEVAAQASEGSPGAEAATTADAATVTQAPAAAEAANTIKSKKSKKAKKNKNKKKKAASTSESDFAIELLNGILDFFN